ncbi:hypothetical protein [Actinomadura chibensis]|uniref:Uncharacterized protein n=1 Tax=Actinomadura chibensis TaxID=392828 RepID=A0A5D0NWR9_9ACTN|nr:hypothetical protein [Actinomadura chibensis]TYB48654.1 hypothetical protein FXF69_05580 [Actinomadura chibensis]
MELESELRKAMAEQVAGTTATPSLVTDVKRRHRRRRARVQAAAGAVAASVAALALVPTYQSFRAAPAGNSETARPSNTVSALRMPERPPASGLPQSPSERGRPGAGTPPKQEGRPPQDGPGGGPRRPGAAVLDDLPRWITYLPSGLAAAAPCAVAEAAGRKTTTCRWAGDGGWVEIVLVKGGGLTGPQDLMKTTGIPGHATVRGMPALTGDHVGSGRQVCWLARRGVGVTVAAGGLAADHLMRIAEGVRP